MSIIILYTIYTSSVLLWIIDFQFHYNNSQSFFLSLSLSLFHTHSLHSNSRLDLNIKGYMIRDVFNIAGFYLPTKDTEIITDR